MKPYDQRLSITRGGRTMVLALMLFGSIQAAHGQARTGHEAAHVAQRATPKTTSTHDPDSDGDGLLRVEGSVRAFTDSTLSLSLRGHTVGEDLILRKRPGRASYADATLVKPTTDAAQTKAQDYNSSRSNNGSVAAPDASTTKYVDKSSTKSHVSDGSLEHTDDWIAARAADPLKHWVILASMDPGRRDLHIPTDVHSGKLTGVRQHSPAHTSQPVDAATPYIYRASVDENGAFVFDGVTPGTYEVRVLADGHEFRGHVTVLK